MALQIHSAASASQLVDELTRQLSVRQADPFGRDVVVVPSSGMREFVIEHLCRSLPTERASGPLLANVEFIFPNEFNNRVLGHRRSSVDPWSASRLRWSVLAELERDPDLLPGYREARRRLARAEKAAMLFEKYAAQRPSMLAEWAEGRCTDGFGALDAARLETYGWQYALWRRVREQVGPSHAEELRSRTPQIEPGVRYWLFSLEFFSPSKIALLAQLGDAAVGIFMLQAPAAKEMVMIPGVAQGQAVARSSFVPEQFINPLNLSWATIAHETNALVGALATAAGATVQRMPPVETPSLLGRLQQSITSDSSQAASLVLQPNDRSVQIHLCHGATRQVQVLRDALLHLFNADPTLHPRDVLVHCLDLETFAPLLTPLLSAGGIPVPVTIIDRSVTTRTSLETAIESVLTVIEDRCTLDEFRDVLSHEAIRASVDLTEDEVALFERVVPSLDVRWGLDAAHRERWGYPIGDDVSTLRHAVDRVLLAALVEGAEGHEVLRGLTPAGDVDGQTAIAFGKISALLSRLQGLATRCAGSHSLQDWSAVLRSILDDLVRLDRDDEWMRSNLDALATQLAESASQFPEVSLGANEFFAQVRAALSGVAGRSRQWADAVRVATPETLRGVPARVVVMLGMDEQRLRKGGVDGDDLLSVTPHVGDRDPRNEHRLGLLTSICSASDVLMVLADGHSVTDNAEIPPAMPLRELIDHLASISDLDPQRNLPFVVQHARQSMDVVNLGVATDDPKKNALEFARGPFTFDASALPIAKKVIAAVGAANDVTFPAVLPAPTVNEAQSDLSLRDLKRAICRPVEVYFEDRLRVRLPAEETTSDDALELWPEGLDRHGFGAALLERGLAGDALDEWWATRCLDGGVPPAELGLMVRDDLVAVVSDIVACANVTGAESVPHQVTLPVPGSSAPISDVVHTIGDVVVEVSFSEWSPHMRIQPLVALAALTLSDRDRVWSAKVVSRGPKPTEAAAAKGAKVGAVSESFRLSGDTAHQRVQSAMAVIDFALSMRARALRSPIMLFERASWLFGYAAPTNVSKQLRTDLRAGYFRWLIPGIDFENFEPTFAWVSQFASGELEEGLPSGADVGASSPQDDVPAAHRYGSALRSMWDANVTVTESSVPIVPPAKKAAAKKAAAKKAASKKVAAKATAPEEAT